MKSAFCFSLVFAAAAQSWTPQPGGTTASLRGISAVSGSVVWASGSGGTFLRTTDGGASWKAGKIPGASDLDFRAIRALDETAAVMLSVGKGETSRIYKTTNAGASWRLIYTNPDPDGFFDALAFWDASHGILLGDPVKGRFEIMTTDDGGESWKSWKGPQAERQEGAFAASNSCLFVRGAREAWFGTGGPRGARVFHSADGGESWSVARTPLRNDSKSAGIFAIAFADPKKGIAVGGDCSKPAATEGNMAITLDGGKTWKAAAPPHGYRSDIQYIADRKLWLVTGTSGSDMSSDDGASWKQMDTAAYNAMSFAGASGWFVGPKGAIARVLFPLLAGRPPDLRLGILAQLFEHP